MIKTKPYLRKPISQVTLKFVTMFIVANIIGMVIGLGHAYAEAKSNINVPGAGQVGTASTNSWGITNGTAAVGSSTSTVNLYKIYANIRFWHSPPGYPPLRGLRDQQIWTNKRGGSTGIISSNGFGDRAVTRSYFIFTSGSTYSGDFYTSGPGTSGSCYNYWNSGSPC